MRLVGNIRRKQGTCYKNRKGRKKKWCKMGFFLIFFFKVFCALDISLGRMCQEVCSTYTLLLIQRKLSLPVPLPFQRKGQKSARFIPSSLALGSQLLFCLGNFDRIFRQSKLWRRYFQDFSYKKPQSTNQKKPTKPKNHSKRARSLWT